MLELARRRARQVVDKTKRAIVYANFADEVGDSSIVDLPGVLPGTNWDRFRAKARAYLRDHEDHLALQRLRRNHPHSGGPSGTGGDAHRVRRRH
jgi:type I restriction enzyme R subunit